jgi:hypothetical protein
MSAARTDGGGSGGGANDGGGNGSRSCNDELVVGRTTVPRHCPPSHAHWRNVESAAGRFKVPRHRWNSLACWHDNKSAAEWTTMPWHCRPFPRSLVRWRRRRADNGVSLLHHWQWGADKAMAVAARPIIMPLESRPSLARSRMARMEAAQTDGGAVVVVRSMAGQCLSIIGRSLARSCDDKLAAGRTTVGGNGVFR